MYPKDRLLSSLKIARFHILQRGSSALAHKIVCFHPSRLHGFVLLQKGSSIFQIGSSALAHRIVCFQPFRSSALTWIVCFDPQIVCFGSKDRLLQTQDRLLSPWIVCFDPQIVCFRPGSSAFILLRIVCFRPFGSSAFDRTLRPVDQFHQFVSVRWVCGRPLTALANESASFAQSTSSFSRQIDICLSRVISH